MPDPALLAIVQHFASPPPAVIQAALIADSEPFLSAYELIADRQDRDLLAWLDGVAGLERKARAAVAATPHDFTPRMFDDLTAPFERHMRWQKRVTARLERRPTAHMSARLLRLRERALARQRQQYEAAAAVVTFLKEMRAEVVARQRAEAPPSPRTPNETTIAAMREAEAGELPRFVTVADLMADLHADD